MFGLLGVPSASATATSIVPEENYDFLAKADGRCVPQIGLKFDPRQEADCKRLAEPRRYRGTWLVAFETSIFTPAGKPHCIEGVTLDYCPDLVLEGSALPWPGRWSCARRFQVDFIGRRSRWVGSELNYRVVVDRVIAVKRLQDPPHDPWDCDAAAQ